MATATEAQQRVTAALETATLMVSDLEEIAREWEGLSDGERASWSLDWSNEMSGLERAAEWAVEGTLTTVQDRKLRALLQRIADARPILDRLNLYAPSGSATR